MDHIRSNRKKIENEIVQPERRALISPAFYAQYKITASLLQKFISGKCIDLGCGEMPYRPLLEKNLDAYDGLDLFPKSQDVKYICDIQNMHLVGDHQYDSAICLEVLEHTPDPMLAIKEIHRILKDHGILVISVPHLSRLHEEPYDFYRFTKYGLIYMLEKENFEVITISEKGGLVSFLGHQFSLAILGAVWGIPILKDITFIINGIFSRVLYNFDCVSRLYRLFPLGYAVVAKKKSGE